MQMTRTFFHSTLPTLALLALLVGVCSAQSPCRLVIERSNVVAPNYRILLYPYMDGDSLPTTTLSGESLTVQIDSQIDTFTFFPRTVNVGGQNVTMNEFTLSRDGSTLFDYRGQIEPISVR